MAARQNPFPGMNPYLERRWGDVHARLASYAADQIQERLPSDLRARMQERIYIESTDEVHVHPRREAYSPDVHVYETRTSPGDETEPQESGGGVAVAIEAAEPVIIQLPETQVVETSVEIIDVGSGGRVITTIEFVSKSNKRPGPGRRQYLRKRKATIRAGASVVEVDLLRGGKPVTLAAPVVAPGSRLWTPYHACVLRSAKQDRIAYYPIPLRARLPVVKIPLRKKEPEVNLDVQALIDEAYRKGRYDDINYAAETLAPALTPEEAAWAAQRVADTAATETAPSKLP
jgi:hypothetical protein